MTRLYSDVQIQKAFFDVFSIRKKYGEITKNQLDSFIKGEMKKYDIELTDADMKNNFGELAERAIRKNVGKFWDRALVEQKVPELMSDLMYKMLKGKELKSIAKNQKPGRGITGLLVKSFNEALLDFGRQVQRYTEMEKQILNKVNDAGDQLIDMMETGADQEDEINWQDLLSEFQRYLKSKSKDKRLPQFFNTMLKGDLTLEQMGAPFGKSYGWANDIVIKLQKIAMQFAKDKGYDDMSKMIQKFKAPKLKEPSKPTLSSKKIKLKFTQRQRVFWRYMQKRNLIG